jgi:hypothetical protein
LKEITPQDKHVSYDFSYDQGAVFLSKHKSDNNPCDKNPEDHTHDNEPNIPDNRDDAVNNDGDGGGGGGALGYLIPLFGLVVLYRRKRYAI